MLQGLSKTGAIKSQSGAISLILLLIVVVTATTLLLGKLNAGIKHSVYSAENGRALQEAKDAIISWAVNHPFNPGTLPMPDRNGDGDYDGDADCFNGVINNNLLLGKIPWRDMPSPCKDAGSLIGLSIFTTDKSGEHLWYAVSKNLVYESPDYPFISPGLLSRTTNWITVRDSSGSVISDRVAFVLIAPGPALAPYTNCDALSYAGQSRTGTAPNPDNYLDSVTIGATSYSNADFDQDFILYTNSKITTGSTTLEKCDAFNDQLVYVTVDDLLDRVSVRVLNETTNFFTTYHNTYVALPWLSPYADPKAEIPIINGEADNAAVSTTTLEDSAVDFVNAGVQVGDLVRNITDGSLGVINSVGVPDNNTVTVGSLVLGTNNDFGNNDEYYITPQSSLYVDPVTVNNYLTGAATGGSSALILENTNTDFIEIGVMPGDIIDNLTDNNSSGVIADVTTNTLTVTALTGGTDNDFDSGDVYRIRNNMGMVTAAAADVLTDTNKNFTLMGVAVGDLVKNITDGSFGRVTIVTANTLTVDKLELGTDNDFDVADVYVIARYNAIANTQQGLLAYHLPGKYFKSEFDMDWSLNGVTLNTTAGAQTEYQTRAQLDAQASASTFNVSVDDGACVWMKEEHVECYGTFDISDVTTGGVVTTGSNTATFTDNTQSYIVDGVKVGDIIQNFNDEATLFTRTADAGSSGTSLVDVGANFTAYNTAGPYELLVRNNTTGVQGVVTNIIDNDNLEAKDYPGGPAISFTGGDSFSLRSPQYMVVSNVVDSDTLTAQRLNATAPDFDVGEYYRIIPSTKITTGTIALAFNPWMNDTSYNFPAEGVEIGDIIENVTDGSFGIITFAFGNWIQATLYGGTTNTFLATNSYRVHHGYASSRKYQFSPRYTGGDTSPLGKTVYASTEVRKRGACIGYGTDCLSAPTASTLPYNLNIPLITITDYEDDNDIAATTTATIPNAGSPTGSILVSNIDYYLREGGNEIPEWFVRNRWHQYVMITFSNGDTPGSTPCSPGTDCLTINIRDAGGTIINSRNDIRAMVMISREELSGQTWPAATASDYFDDASNINLTDTLFDRYPQSNTFNDLIRISSSCATDPVKLCWSN